MTNYNDDISKAQFLDGTSGEDTFIIAGLSTEYDWEKVLDPRGQTIMIVWKKDGTGQADVLNNMEHLQFTDTIVTPDVSENGTIYTTTSTDGSDTTSDTSSNTSSDDTSSDDTSSDDPYSDDTSSDDTSSDDSYSDDTSSDDTSSDDTYSDDTSSDDTSSDDTSSDDTSSDDTYSDDTSSDDTAEHDVDLDEYIYDEADVSEEIDGYGGEDSFVISADSSKYGWNPTEDGQGVVVWNPETGCFDILWNMEEIIFDDITVQVSDIMAMPDTGPSTDDGSCGNGSGNDSGGSNTDNDTPGHDLDLDEYIYDEYYSSEEINGYGGHDSFVISASSSEYSWEYTEDGEGIIVWNDHTNCYDVLYNVEEIIFDDMIFDVTEVLGGGYDDGGSDDNGSDNGGSTDGSDDSEYIMDDAWVSETIDGMGGEDTFVIDGHSDDFMWDWTDDGQGIMIWNLDTDATDTLYNIEEIWFDDTSVWVDDLNGSTDGGSDDNGSDNGGSTDGSDDSEYIMDDAWVSETIDGMGGEDTFVIDGHSDDFMWDWTDDGQGIMIWNLDTDATDTLYNIEEIWFDDTSVWVDDLNGSSNSNTNSYTNNNTTNDNNENNNSDNTNTNDNSDTGADEYIMDDASKSEVIDGGAGDDTFVIDGNSADFMWDTTDDGNGILIYNEVTDTMDELINIEEIEFNDTAVLVEDLI